jgi:hypothetical protein
MKMSAFDTWLTTEPTVSAMNIVTAKEMTEEEEGFSIPMFIDELECEDCNQGIGWCSEGSFTEFYTDEQEKHYKCEDCHDEWCESEK